MSTDLLGISVTGLRVAQTSLSTTGHNIANAGAEGYSRQEVRVETNSATPRGTGYIGNGANIAAIERVVNEFLTEQLQQDGTLFNELDAYYDNIAQLDTLLSDSSTGLSSAMESFFAAVQNGADDPTSIPSRTLLISEAENLADRFNTLFSRFETLDASVEDTMLSAVSQINALVTNIAELNKSISDASSFSEGASPNDLLDQRDEAVRQLSELISIQSYSQGTQLNIVVGSGQNLVVGTQARQLQLVPGAENAAKTDLVFQEDTGGQVITDLVSGGELGGLIRFRDTIMDDTYNQFGRIALVMADTFNEIHQHGISLENEFGGLFFTEVNDPLLTASRVIGNSNNATPSDRVMSLNILDSSVMTASDYSVEIESGGLYRVTRLSDDVEVTRGLLPGSLPFTVEFDGLELEFTSGSFQGGDSFRLLPTRTGGRDFQSLLINPEDLAFGSPVLTDASIGNIGSGKISPGQVLSLVDSNNNALPLLQNAGEMNPPLLIKFNTPTNYDILDNSDPGNPVDLDPPIRNKTFVPGINTDLFPTDSGETQISTNGEMAGLPDGRHAIDQASIQITGAAAPGFAVTDFSGAANQFAFDIVVSNTPSGVNDGTFTVTVDGAALTSNATLLTEINTQISTTDVRAYIADNGSLAFRLRTPGYGDITLNNYNGDPDGGGGTAPAGQANTLMGFAIETTTYTTVADANGTSGSGALTNGYPAEVITITRPGTTVGEADTVENIFTSLNASVRATASQLNNIAGVSANAFNYIEVSNFGITRSEPLQISLNGEDLLPYELDSTTGGLVLSALVPDPVANIGDFNDYVAERINSNANLSDLGIYALAGNDGATENPELRIHSTLGDDLQISLTAAAGENFDVSDGVNPNLTLVGEGNSVASTIVVGGRMDVTLEDTLVLGTLPPQSMLFGDTTAADFSQNTYLGIQAAINGIPEGGDQFTIDFNANATSDNRNILDIVNLEDDRTIGGDVASFSSAYGALVEDIGIDTSASRINRDAAEQVLEQTTGLRNSVSAVNLDEEAAQLIKFEQMFSANAQVISVARDLFDRLISSF